MVLIWFELSGATDTVSNMASKRQLAYSTVISKACLIHHNCLNLFSLLLKITQSTNALVILLQIEGQRAKVQTIETNVVPHHHTYPTLSPL